MKYIYYSLYQFYTKIIKVQKYYPPVVNIAGIIGLLQAILIFSLINIYIFSTTQNKVLPYHALIPFGVAMVFYYFNEKYFEAREAKIIKELNDKPLFVKILSHLFTIAVIIVLVWGHFFDGFYKFIFN
jgi:hypothetical protein